MSLAEKLSKMSEAHQIQKQQEENQTKEAELAIIKGRIEDLEQQKYVLGNIFESLNYEANEGDGSTMKNYPSKVSEDIINVRSHIENLFNENKDVLLTHGIDTVEKLIESDIANDTPEIKEYREVHEDKRYQKELNKTDDIFYNKLVSFGVINEADESIRKPDGSLDYEKANFLIKLRLEEIDDEILLEKIKTPEGNEAKEILIEKLSKEIIDDIPDVFFRVNKNTHGADELEIGRNSGRILIYDDKVKFDGFVADNITPDILKALEIKYGEELTDKSLEKAYRVKINDAFKYLDRERNNNEAKLYNDLERSNPEKWQEAKEAYDDYNNQANYLRSVLSAKSKDFESREIHFNPKHITGYGGTYEDLIAFAEYESDNKKIKEAFHFGSSIYPPGLYYDTLKTFIDTRKDQLNELISVIENLDDNFDFRYRDNQISSIHKKILQTNLDKVRRKTENIESLRRFNFYNNASEYFEKKLKEREDIKLKVLEKIHLAAEYIEIRNELKKGNWSTHTEHLDRHIKQIEDRAEEAKNALNEILKLELEIPDEELILDGNYITVVSVKKELDNVRQEIRDKENKLNFQKQEYQAKLNSKPPLFGKEAWNKKLETMAKEIDILSTEVNYLNNEKYKDLVNKLKFYINTPNYSHVQNQIKSLPVYQGNKETIIRMLTSKVNEIINTKVPDKVIQLSKKYKDLEQELF